MIYAIFLYLVCAYSLRFFMRLKYNIDFEGNLDAFFSLLLMILIFFGLISCISKNINEAINYCSKYSFIPFFLFFQIIICFLILYLICIINLIIGYIVSNFKQPTIYNTLGFIFKILYMPIKNRKFLDPFYKIPKKRNSIPIIYNLKSIIFVCYLISGVILLSPIYNFITGLSEAKEYLTMLKNDYDTYKSVFVTSLIPYFLNFAIVNKKDYLTQEEEIIKKEENTADTLNL